MDLSRIPKLDTLPLLEKLPFIDRIPVVGGSTTPLVLEIDLTRGLIASTPTDLLAALRSRQVPVLSDVVAGLRRGAKDAHVVAVVVRIADTIGVAEAEELGTALRGFAAAGKRTIAVAASFGELGPGTVSYYLASHADTVWLQPSGSVGLTGVALEVTTFRGVLDKIGAEPQLGQRHEFKTAAETFMSREVSQPNRDMTQRIADSVMQRVVQAGQSFRGLTAQQMQDAIAASPLSATDALARGLVDHVGYYDQAYAWVRETLGVDGEVRLAFAHRYAKHQAAKPAEQVRRRKQPKVALVSVSGGIVTGRNAPGPFGGTSAGSDSVCAALRLAREDDSVKAVVLRIDSPGGSYVASDAIRDAVLTTRATGRPVVASMGSVAASGGYFAAMPCDEIVALPSTLTGSIGVLGGKVVLQQTMERIGVTREAIGSHQDSTMFTTVAPFNEDQWSKVSDWLDAVYADFTTKAADDRDLPLDQLEPLARGRVWTGSDAQERGLVDRLGGLATAVERACDRAGIDPDQSQVVAVPHLSPLQRLVPAESSESAAAAATRGSEGLLDGLVRSVGLSPAGVLSLPWQLTIR